LVFGNRAANVTKAEQLEGKGVEVIPREDRDIAALLKELGRRSISSVLVEGGSNIAGSFVDSGLVNKVTFFIAPKIVGGSKAPTAIGGVGVERMRDALKLEAVKVSQHGEDIEMTGYPTVGKE
jgi:diaminohydroxyphosphoribosylaminopyrimidine deaminase/5-amino-6-(5-phosphoribosylamino)uracil reductase